LYEHRRRRRPSPWNFTIGLFEAWHCPEQIVIGRSRAIAYATLSTIATELEDKRRPDLKSQELYVPLGIACQFIEVHERYYTDCVGITRWYHRGKHFPLYQIGLAVEWRPLRLEPESRRLI
jgi:hypothetical protein